MAASSRQDTSTGETSIDSSSSRDEAESSRTEKYHPRSILFSGPPQVLQSAVKGRSIIISTFSSRLLTNGRGSVLL